MSSKLMIKSLDKKFLSGVLALIFLLAMAMSEITLSQESRDGEQNILRQASQQWMQVGIKQYRRDLFTEAERSFRRARIFQNYLTAAERDQLNELLANAHIAISEGKQAVTETKSADESFEPNQPVKAEVIVEKVKESESSTEKERKQIKEEPVLITEGREQTEERAKTEAQLLAQAQAYVVLEEQLKAETQARLKAQQEAEAQTKQRVIIEAEYAEAVSAAKARATEKAELHAAAIKELERKLESQAKEITRAEAKAESTTRLEAEKIASQEATARAKLEKQLRAETELRTIIEAEAEEAIASAKADAEVKAESYAATIKQTEEKLKVQTEEVAKAEAQLQAQAQAYAALEEQLKAETQARLKARQEAQTQAQAKTRAKATTEAVAIDQATQNKIDELIRLLGDKEPTIRNSAVEDLEQRGESAVPSLISPNTPKEQTIDMGNGITMEFVLIPAGEFDMGSPSTESDRGNDESPVHRVKISRPFYMGKYEVTQEQYYVVAKYRPSRFKQEGRPVENVSWDQANRFCGKLSEMKGGTYRLPTEAEWEYACRAGSQEEFYFGDDPAYSQIERYAWYLKNSQSVTHPVGKKKPNSFGLYDMHGNVWEWCGDWYAADYYRRRTAVDPPGPQLGKSRVLRGGSWFHKAWYCGSASRDSLEPYYIRNHIGFRVVLEVE